MHKSHAVIGLIQCRSCGGYRALHTCTCVPESQTPITKKERGDEKTNSNAADVLHVPSGRRVVDIRREMSNV